ncbi:hypothetical protein KIMH_08070 [Bombiscardovia apis]|uniref:Uncharacterized protein n=1 Tax=Bombiscardovia apis TaxID=2932182 RepID=A0ABM8BCQ2_9BIFI|nr:hypothetical protein [Bombiscardovia apis]BDR54696.1 hypothetical protein KIMH_08070 [Bombiscardovia apis]
MSEKQKIALSGWAWLIADLSIIVVTKYFGQQTWGVVFLILASIIELVYCVHEYRMSTRQPESQVDLRGIDLKSLKDFRREHRDLSLTQALEAYSILIHSSPDSRVDSSSQH